MRNALVLLILVSLSIAIFGQEREDQASQQTPLFSNKEILQLPIPRRGFKPKVTLQESLRLAESYIKKEKIDISSFYLLEARLIGYGGERDVKEPRWYLRWVDQNGQIGKYIEITVSMEGTIVRYPSM